MRSHAALCRWPPSVPRSVVLERLPNDHFGGRERPHIEPPPLAGGSTGEAGSVKFEAGGPWPLCPPRYRLGNRRTKSLAMSSANGSKMSQASLYAASDNDLRTLLISLRM